MGVGVASVVQGFRLIPSKYPTINLFDDVANEDEFSALYELQALTNPRLANEVGDMSLLDQKEIPFHCKRGRSYAIAAFTHINRDGSRFANGQHGMLYIADDEKTATREVQFHQAKYWRNVTGLKYDRIIFRTLKFTFDDSSCIDITDKPMSDSIYDPDNYLTAQKFGLEVYMNRAETTGIKYNSVRSENGVCWALSTPYVVQDVIQCSHTEMVWNGSDIKHVDKIKPMKL